MPWNAARAGITGKWSSSFATISIRNVNHFLGLFLELLEGLNCIKKWKDKNNLRNRLHPIAGNIAFDPRRKITIYRRSPHTPFAPFYQHLFFSLSTAGGWCWSAVDAETATVPVFRRNESTARIESDQWRKKCLSSRFLNLYLISTGPTGVCVVLPVSKPLPLLCCVTSKNRSQAD